MHGSCINYCVEYFSEDKMKRWYTNGVDELQVEDGREPPVGYYPGYSEKRKSNISKSTIGRTPHNKGKKESIKHIYYTNGKISIRIPENQLPPDGFVRGRLKRRMTEEERKTFNNKIWKTKQERYGNKYYNNMEKTEYTCLQRYGVVCQLLRDDVFPTTSSDTKPNLMFIELLTKNGIQIDDREFVINGRRKRYDIRVGTNLIEINPSAYHNSTFCPLRGNEALSRTYHYDKTHEATESGYRCINVWDWDDPMKIVGLLSDKPIVYARKCAIKEVSAKDARIFLNKNHLQGYVPSKIRIGLFFNEEIVSIMTFGSPRYNKNFQFELLRYCSICKVVGGAEKLFNFFLKKYNPESVVSYCDLSKFSGNMYYNLGFRLIKTSIGRHWYNMKLDIHITDNLLRKNGFDRLLGKYFGTFGKGTSNRELMLSHGFVEIFDAGQATFSWRRE